MKAKLFSMCSLILVGLLLMSGLVSATTWTKSVVYEDNDLTAVFKDWWNLPLISGEQGRITLRSHESVNQVLQVPVGQAVPMFYDFSFKELVESGLGDVEFINMKTGRQVERDYKFVYWATEKRERDVCVDWKETQSDVKGNGTISTECAKYGVESYDWQGWKDYDSRNIPKGDLRIGVEIETRHGEHIDGVWNIGSKRIDKHAQWESSLETNLVSWWKFEDNLATTNFIDAHGNNDLTGNKNSNAMTTANGQIGRAVDFTGGNDFLARDLSYSLANNKPVAISFWYKPNSFTNDKAVFFYGSSASNDFMLAVIEKTSGGNKLQVGIVDDGTAWRGVVTSPKIISNGNWYHVAINYYANKTLEIYVNGGDRGSVTTTSSRTGTGRIRIGTSIYAGNTGAGEYSNLYVDEFAIWNRTLTLSEITHLSGNNCTYQDCGLPPVEINLATPTNNSFFSNSIVNFSALITTPLTLENVSLVINDAIISTNTSGLNGTYAWTIDLENDGVYNWKVIAYDEDDEQTNSTTWKTTIDTTPPTIQAELNQTILYAPGQAIKILSNITDTNIDKCWYSYNGTNTLFDCGLNKETNIVTTFNSLELVVYANDSANNTASQSFVLTIDDIAPTLTLFSPIANLTTLNASLNVSLNYSVVDDNIGSCWYNSTQNTTIKTFTCNTIPQINFTTPGWHSIDYWANDTAGNEANGSTSFYIFYIQRSANSTTASITEGGLGEYWLYVNMTDVKDYSPTATFYFGNYSQGQGTLTNVSQDVVRFDKSIIIPSINATSTANWTWVYNLSTNPKVENWNISGTQTYIPLNITECGTGTYRIFNFTIFDEDTRIVASDTNASIELDLTLTSKLDSSITRRFNIEKKGNKTLLICLPTDSLNFTNYTIDATARYTHPEHVVEYYYIVNATLTKDNIPNNIKLHNLATARSTSFLVNYQDKNYLFVSDAIVDIWREYVGTGEGFISVEHGKTDISGQTRAHLVTEDVVYKALVWKNGQLLYTSPSFFALCQTTPCQINLREKDDTTGDASIYGDVVFTYDEDKANRQVVFTFATTSGLSTEMNLTIVRADAFMNETIFSEKVESSGGTITATIPMNVGNETYRVVVLRDGYYFGQSTFSLDKTAFEVFGYTGIILTALAFLMISLMGITSGIATIVFGIISLVMMSAVQMFEGGSVFGLGSAIVWLIVAGAIIIWKINNRRIS